MGLSKCSIVLFVSRIAPFTQILCWPRFSQPPPYWNEISDRRQPWSNMHIDLTGDVSSTQAIQADNLPFDPSVPPHSCPFPSVLDMMARDPRLDRPCSATLSSPSVRTSWTQSSACAVRPATTATSPTTLQSRRR